MEKILAKRSAIMWKSQWSAVAEQSVDGYIGVLLGKCPTTDCYIWNTGGTINMVLIILTGSSYKRCWDRAYIRV